MSDVLRLRLRLRVAALSPLAGAVLGLSCSGATTPMPTCPSGSWCGESGEVLESLRQTSETVLTCPKYLTWGQDGGAPPAPELTRFGEASLDVEATRKRRVAGATGACCYHWYQPCPGGR